MEILRKGRQIAMLMILTILIIVNHLAGQINVDLHTYLDNKDGFQGKLNLSIALAEGEVDMITVTSLGSLGYCKGKNAILLSGDLAYGKAGKSVYTDMGAVGLRYGRILSRLFSFEIFCQLDRDKVRLIKRRAWIGSGLRLSFDIGGTGGSSQKQADSKSVKPLTFSLGAGFLYMGQKFYGRGTPGTPGYVEPLADVNQVGFASISLLVGR